MKYLWLTIKHKWFVFLAGKKTGCSLWRRITHDLSKLSPAELPHYQRQFFGKADDPRGFIRCWIHHQNHNDHHWEYWIPRTGHNRCVPPYPDGKPVPMSLACIREMVADWLGASRAYGGKWPTKEEYPWFDENWDQIAKQLHPATKQAVMGVLEEIGIRTFCCQSEAHLP